MNISHLGTSTLRTSTLRTTFIAAGLTLLGLSTAHAQATYSGDAFGIRQDELSSLTYYGEAGPMPSPGGSFTGSLTSYNDIYGYASSGAGNAAMSAGGNVMNASSTLNGFTFTYNGQTASATSMTATASADLSSISGSVIYTDLFVTGSGLYDGTYTGTVPANTIFDFGAGATLELNREVTGLGVVNGPTISNYDTAYGMQAYDPGVFSIQAAVAGADVDTEAPSTPEPGSIALLTGLTISGGVFLKRRRRKLGWIIARRPFLRWARYGPSSERPGVRFITPASSKGRGQETASFPASAGVWGFDGEIEGRKAEWCDAINANA